MTNPNKDKGSKFERDVARYLTEHGIECERTRAGWADDRGDLDGPGLVNFAVECKDVGRIDLAGFCDQALMEALHKAKATRRNVTPVVVVKRRQRPVADAYCVVSLDWMTQLLKDHASLEGNPT